MGPLLHRHSPDSRVRDGYRLAFSRLSQQAPPIFEQALRHDGRLCLGLMLTIERNSLSEEVTNEVQLFVDQHTAWLAAAWDLGRSDLTVKSDLFGDAVSPVLFSALEGMMAFALVQPNPEAVFRAQAAILLAALAFKRRALLRCGRRDAATLRFHQRYADRRSRPEPLGRPLLSGAP